MARDETMYTAENKEGPKTRTFAVEHLHWRSVYTFGVLVTVVIGRTRATRYRSIEYTTILSSKYVNKLGPHLFVFIGPALKIFANLIIVVLLFLIFRWSLLYRCR
jgi:hypothetical protein